MIVKPPAQPRLLNEGPAAIQALNPRSLRMLAGMESLLPVASSATTKPSPRALHDVSNLISPRSTAKKPAAAAPLTGVVEVEPPLVARFVPKAPPGRMTQEEAAPKPVASARTSMTPSSALQLYSQALSAYERQEILNYPDVYYVGETARKLQCSPTASSATANNNFGYDDDKGDYRTVLDDHIAYRYQMLNELGRGSFGQVSRALDHKTKQMVAIKIIKNKKKFFDQAQIEVNLLKHLRDNDSQDKHNIVRMIDSFVFRQHMIVVFDLHNMNLYELCKANRFAPMTFSMIRHFAKQMLDTLQYLSDQNVVHCDLKPENILLKNGSKSTIKVIDFGSSCFESQRLYTYIQSRFYRAPEVMLGIPYTRGIDMWSFGCILAELANGFPIFPGESEQEQMCCVMEFLGVPPKSLVDRGSRKKLFFDAATGAPKCPANSKGRVRRPASKELGAFLRASNANAMDPEGASFVDFVRQCLQWDPEKRWNPAQAMLHPWMGGSSSGAATRASEQPTASTARATLSDGGAVGPPSPRIVLPKIPTTGRRR